MIRPVLLMFTLLWAGSAAAQGVPVRTLIEVNVTNGQATVTHRFDARATAPMLPQVVPGAPANLEDPAAAEALGRYAGRAFRIGAPLKLESYAAQGDQVLVSYSAQLRAGSPKLTVDSDLFEKADPAASTEVEVRAGELSRTLRFDRETKAQTIDLNAP